MATSGETIAYLIPPDTEIPSGGQVALVKRASGLNQFGRDVLQFQGQDVGHQQVSNAIWDFILRRSAAASTGYTGTTGLQVKIHWFAPKQSQAVVWAVSFQLDGQTDLPAPATENFPANGSTNEVTATANANTTTSGGLVVTSISVPLAKIQNGQATAPAQGDSVRLRLRRALDNAADTLTDYAYVTMVEVVDY